MKYIRIQDREEIIPMWNVYLEKQVGTDDWMVKNIFHPDAETPVLLGVYASKQRAKDVINMLFNFLGQKHCNVFDMPKE